MIVKMEIPDPKFNVGDIVQIDNERNDRQIYLKIHNYSMEGSWKVTPEGVLVTKCRTDMVRSDGYLEYQEYCFCTFEPDSWTDSVEPAPLTGEIVMNLSELDTKGKLKEAT